jgi:hypothetical protein
MPNEKSTVKDLDSYLSILIAVKALPGFCQQGLRGRRGVNTVHPKASLGWNDFKLDQAVPIKFEAHKRWSLETLPM